jgi:hypothetical protein
MSLNSVSCYEIPLLEVGLYPTVDNVPLQQLILEAKLKRKLKRTEHLTMLCGNYRCVEPRHIHNTASIKEHKELWGTLHNDDNVRRASMYADTNPNAVLTTAAVDYVRDLLDSGMSQRRIVQAVRTRYGITISQQNVSRIKRGDTWRTQ